MEWQLKWRWLIYSGYHDIGGVCNLLSSVLSQHKFEGTDQCYSTQMDQCYSSMLQLGFI